jgi:hypothetical protein
LVVYFDGIKWTGDAGGIYKDVVGEAVGTDTSDGIVDIAVAWDNNTGRRSKNKSR